MRSCSARCRRQRDADAYTALGYDKGRVASLNDTPRLRQVGPAAEAERSRKSVDLGVAARLARSLTRVEHSGLVKELGQRLVVAQHERILEQRLELLRRRRSRSHDANVRGRRSRRYSRKLVFSPATEEPTIQVWLRGRRNERWRVSASSRVAARSRRLLERGRRRRLAGNSALHGAALVHARPCIAAGDEPLRPRPDPRTAARVARPRVLRGRLPQHHECRAVKAGHLDATRSERWRPDAQSTLARKHAIRRRPGAARSHSEHERARPGECLASIASRASDSSMATSSTSCVRYRRTSPRARERGSSSAKPPTPRGRTLPGSLCSTRIGGSSR